MTPAERVTAYLDGLEQHGQMAKAAGAAGRSLRYFQKLRLSDREFAAAEADALDIAKDLVRSEITRRAVEGVKSTVATKYGVFEKTEYSNTLLLRLAEYLETGTWRLRQQVETGAPGAFKSMAELEAAIANREADLAQARAEMAAEDARDRGEAPPVGDKTASAPADKAP